jgi:hypothetical protein
MLVRFFEMLLLYSERWEVIDLLSEYFVSKTVENVATLNLGAKYSI